MNFVRFASGITWKSTNDTFGNDARIDGITGRPVGPTNELSLSVTQGFTLGWDTDQPFGLMAIDADQLFCSKKMGVHKAV